MKSKFELKLLEIIGVVLFLFSVFSISLLIADRFSSLNVIFATVTTLVILYLIFRPSISLKDNRFDLVILIIVAIALLMRISPWLYLEGGQDEGVYIAMSRQFEVNGGFIVKDSVKPKLSDADRAVYETEWSWHTMALQKSAANTLSFPFYPLHPALMAITGFLLGDSNRVFELTIFSVLSIIFIYLLTTAITGKKKLGYFAAVLLALSPLHLYFSRFPVTEVMALALNLGMLYYLLKGFKEGSGLYLSLSVFFFAMAQFTRLTGIVSFIFLAVALFSIFVYEKEKERTKKFAIAGLGYWIAYISSLLFYYFKIPSIYEHFYRGDVFKIIPEKLFLGVLILLPIIFFILVKYLRKWFKIILEFVYGKRTIIAYGLLVIIFGIGLYYFYKMAFTNAYVGTWFDSFWGMAKGGWVIFKDTVIMSYLLYLTPMGLILLLVALKKINTPEKAFLVLYFLMYLFFNMYVNKYTPYHFYYARYILSEVIPTSFVLAVIGYDELKESKLFKLKIKDILLFSIFAYSLLFVTLQYQGFVGTTPKFFERLERSVDKKNDIVIYFEGTEFPHSFIFSPLRYYYEFNSLWTSNPDSLNKYISDLPKYYKVFVLSTKELKDNRLELVDNPVYEKGYYASVVTQSPPMNVKATNVMIPFCNRFISERYCSGIIPVRYHLGTLQMYLYKVK